MNNKNNQKLLEIVKQNPELPLIPATYYDVVVGDYGYWVGEVEKVEVDFFYLAEERWYAGEEAILEHLELKMDNSGELLTLNDSEANDIIKKEFYRLVEKGEIKKAIIMYITV